MIVVGSWMCSLVAYGTAHIHSDWAWRGFLLSQLVFPLLMLFCAGFILPESPSWLIIHGKLDKAAISLHIFNGPAYDYQTAIALREAAIQKEKELSQEQTTFLDCFRGTNRRRTIIVIITFLA